MNYTFKSMTLLAAVIPLITSAQLSSNHNQLWHQNAGLNGGAEDDDAFGNTLATGDFNGDGYKDLAIGAPREDIGTIARAGAVNIIYGTVTGLNADNNRLYFEGFPIGVGGVPETDDGFGNALASGDFNGDGYDDLAIGIAGQAVTGFDNAGMIVVVYGSDNGLSSTAQTFTQSDLVLFGDSPGNLFGSSLASGDFDNDGKDDLAIGAPGDSVGMIEDAGTVIVVQGSANGLDFLDHIVWSQDSPGIEGLSESGDFFGSYLTVGNFNGDNTDDLAIGTPNEAIGIINNAGAVNILYSNAFGLTATGDQLLYEGNEGVPGTPTSLHFFGRSISAGDFNNDGSDSLVIGLESADSMTMFNNSGIGIVVPGTNTGLDTASAYDFDQDTQGVEGVAEVNDNFGHSLTVGDFNGDSYDDLVVGVYGESVGPNVTAVSRAGAINVIYGNSAGLTITGNQMFTQDSPYILEQAESDDNFGTSLVSGDFNNDGFDDLSIGVRNESVNATPDAGAVNVLYGADLGDVIFANFFESID